MSGENPKLIEVGFTFRTKDGIKRPTVTVEYEAPDANDIAKLLTDGDEKVKSLIVDTVQNVLNSHIRTFVDADSDFEQATLDKLIADGKISLEAIANLPKSERNTTSKDDLEAFAKNYIEVMVPATGKELKKIQAAAGLFVERFRRVAGDNKVLEILQNQLSVYVEAAGDAAAEHEKAITYLSSKLEELLSIKVTADEL
jgi:hypothetical protein